MMLTVLVLALGAVSLMVGGLNEQAPERPDYRADLMQTHTALTRQAFAGEAAAMMAEHRDLLKDLHRTPFEQAVRDEMKTRYAALRKKMRELDSLNQAMTALPQLSQGHSLDSEIRQRVVKMLMGVRDDLKLHKTPEPLVRSMGGVYVVLDQEGPGFVMLLGTLTQEQTASMLDALSRSADLYSEGKDLEGNQSLLAYLDMVRRHGDMLEANFYNHIEAGRIKDAHRLTRLGGLIASLQTRLNLPAMMALQEINHTDLRPLLAHNREVLDLPDLNGGLILKTAGVAGGLGVLAVAGAGMLLKRSRQRH